VLPLDAYGELAAFFGRFMSTTQGIHNA
jgi:hypothetical protein